MRDDGSGRWRCISCWATDRFIVTPTYILHVGKRHVGRVVDAEDNIVQFEVK